MCLSLFRYAILSVHSSFIIILSRKRELMDLLFLSFGCLGTLNVLWLFLMVPWVGLQCVIVVCPNHTHFWFCKIAVEMDGQQCTRFVPCSQY